MGQVILLKNSAKDFSYFVKGGYSKFSNDYKLKILEFHFLEMDGQTAQILFQAPKRKQQLEQALGCILAEDSELLSIMTPEQETFDILLASFVKIKLFLY